MNEPWTVALSGNPNVGKSTLFNQLTGLKQHTGNWPGKTVALASGVCEHGGRRFLLYDLPGAYSLAARSAEEEVARDFILSGNADCVVIVLDATSLRRNLNLALQILEITGRAVICVNLMDEAARQGIRIDLQRLSEMTRVPVVGISARGKRGLNELMSAVANVRPDTFPYRASYPKAIQKAVADVRAAFPEAIPGLISPEWAALRLIENDRSMRGHPVLEPFQTPSVLEAALTARQTLRVNGYPDGMLTSAIVETLYRVCHEIYQACVTEGKKDAFTRQMRLDALLTSRALGIPMMLLLLAAVFYITIVGANVPSAWLANLFERGAELLARHLPSGWLTGLMVDGVYRVTAWVISVMLPPMAIFFPMFTLLEDMGYLPRVSFNLDRAFSRCRACGKQSLTLMMGLGCNAAGVIGCRIIDSPRERLIAILTNALVPCNGRFPTMIMLLGVLFAGSRGAPILSALGLTALLALGVAMTLLSSLFLSKTLLKGVPSAFTLELPPYRKPEIGKVLVRSLLDRTLFVLGRALVVAAPAGAILYLLANISPGGASLLSRMAGALDPIGRFLGMDGMTLTAFILGFPANEIVLPVAAMGYLSAGSLVEVQSLSALWGLLTANGWTALTAVSFLIFSLFHWPCSTTCLTIWKESGRARWMFAAMILPTLIGFAFCALNAFVWRLFL